MTCSRVGLKSIQCCMKIGLRICNLNWINVCYVMSWWCRAAWCEELQDPIKIIDQVKKSIDEEVLFTNTQEIFEIIIIIESAAPQRLQTLRSRKQFWGLMSS